MIQIWFHSKFYLILTFSRDMSGVKKEALPLLLGQFSNLQVCISILLDLTNQVSYVLSELKLTGRCVWSLFGNCLLITKLL